MSFRIGIDIGGTFTDPVSIDDKGSMKTAKVPTTPEDLTVGVKNSFSMLAELNGLSLNAFLKQVTTIVHGTTVGTNLIVQRSGPKLGLIATRGHRDVLQLRRVPKENMYDWRHPFPEPLIPRYLRVEVEERIGSKGEVLVPLNEENVRRAVAFLKEEKVEGIVIALIFSFLNPNHEKRVAEIIREDFPEAAITLSHQVLPAIGEYERTNTATINAYIQPVIVKYIDSLTRFLKDEGFKGQLLFIQNNGGVETAEIAKEKPATLASSGPAGGPSAASILGKIHGEDNVLSLDMGGTSLDAAIVYQGRSLIKHQSLIENLRFSMPVLDVNSMGAGGGSIAWFDLTGTLRVGPRSAAGVPGPACYNRGGTEPTVTDADVILGYVNPDHFLGGRMKLRRDLAEGAIREKIAAQLGISLEEAAIAIYRIINSHMADTVSYTFTRRGYDPRDFVLVAGGAAGAVHAMAIARHLSIQRILIPKAAPAFCAFGMLGVDLKHDYSRFYHSSLEGLDLKTIRELYQEMETDGLEVLARESVPPDKRVLVRTLQMRYFGQFRSIEVEWPNDKINRQAIAQGVSAFHKKHQDLYGHSDENYPLEITSFGLSAIGKMPPVALKPVAKGSQDSSAALKGLRQVYFEEANGFAKTRIYDGDKFSAGNTFEGPSVVEEKMTNVVVPPGYKMQVDDFGNYITIQ
jgi:N-methylhydantoinase A